MTNNHPLTPKQLLGKVSLKTASEINSSNWSIGAETMDRDFTLYEKWKKFLGHLGFKKARIQSGWMKTEVQKGIYHWDWLDAIVNDMYSQGVTPWISLSYGNPLYCTFIGHRNGDIPRTFEAKRAWENYVEQLVLRYRNIVNEWEIWNEPRISKGITPQEYADLVIQTAKVIKQHQSNAKVIILALDHTRFKEVVQSKHGAQNRVDNFGESQEQAPNIPYAKEVMDYLRDAKVLFLINSLSYHPYYFNPDDATKDSIAFRKFAKSYASHLDILQGECGVPSTENKVRALANYPWTEISQAKWGLRRLMNDLYLGIPSSYFSIADMIYGDEINRKGTLLIDENKNVIRPKKIYHSLQNLASIFDKRIKIDKDISSEIQDEFSQYITVHSYKDAANRNIIALWDHKSIPDNTTTFNLHHLTFSNCSFKEPVYIDLLSGDIYDIESLQSEQTKNNIIFKNVPIADYPILIAEKAMVMGYGKAV